MYRYSTAKQHQLTARHDERTRGRRGQAPRRHEQQHVPAGPARGRPGPLPAGTHGAQGGLARPRHGHGHAQLRSLRARPRQSDQSIQSFKSIKSIQSIQSIHQSISQPGSVQWSVQSSRILLLNIEMIVFNQSNK